MESFEKYRLSLRAARSNPPAIVKSGDCRTTYTYAKASVHSVRNDTQDYSGFSTASH